MIVRGPVDGLTGGSNPDFSLVKLLSGFEGSDASTTFDDESASDRTLAAAGNAQIDTAQFKFGASSLLLDGTGDRVTMFDSADFAPAGEFTFECHLRINSLTGAYLLCQDGVTGGTRSFGLGVNADGSVFFYCSNLGTTLVTVTSAVSQVTTNTWYHLAADRDGSDVLRIYLDGVMKDSDTFTGGIWNGAAVPVIGARSDGAAAFNGWVDEVRFTHDACYASDGGFTPPVAAYPRS